MLSGGSNVGLLKVSLTSDTAQFQRGFEGANREISNFHRNAERSGATMRAAFAAGAAGIAALVATYRQATQEAEKFERLGLRTEALLRATGSAAGFTSAEIRSFAEEVASSTLASVEGVEAAQQRLLTFRSVSGEVFRDAIRLSQDLAAVGFGSLESNAAQLGRALEDPVNGLNALRRAGVSFTQSQRDQIRTFVETNNLAAAQGMIIESLKEQVGGAGEGEAGGLAGAFDTLGQNAQTFLRNVGNNGPIQATTRFIDGLAASVSGLNDALFPDTGRQIAQLAQRRRALEEQMAGEGRWYSRGESREAQRQIALIDEQIVKTVELLQAEERRAAESQAEARSAAARAAEARIEELESERRRVQSEADQEARQRAGQQSIARRQAIIDALEREVETLGMTTAEMRLYDLAVAGASESQLSHARSIAETIAEAQRQQELQARAAQLYDETRTPIERLNVELAELHALLAAGVIDWDTYARAVEDAEERFDPILAKVDETKGEFSELELAIRGWGEDSARAIADFATDGSRSFSRLANSIINDIIRMIAFQTITKPLFDAFSNSSIGQSMGLSTDGNRRFGGPTRAQGFYEVNEDGPELLTSGGRTYLMMGDQSGYVTPAMGGGGGMGGGETRVNVQLTNNSSTQLAARTQARVTDTGAVNLEVELVEMVTNALTRDTQRGRGLAPVLENRYALNPAAGAMR